MVAVCVRDKGIFHNTLRLCSSGFIVLSVKFFFFFFPAAFARYCVLVGFVSVCLVSHSYSQHNTIDLLVMSSCSHQDVLVIFMSVHPQLCVTVGVQWRSRG